MTDRDENVKTSGFEGARFTDVLAVLTRRKWIVILSVLLFLLLGLRLAVSPRRYAADSMLRVQPGASGEYRASLGPSPSEAVVDQTSPYVDILQSRTLYLRVATELDLANDPAFGDARVHGRQSITDPAVQSRVLKTMTGSIDVAHKLKDQIIRVSCTTRSPALSTKITNTLVNDYVEYLFQTRYGASQRTTGWLTGQLNALKTRVESDQTELTALQGKLGILGLNSADPGKDNDYLAAHSLDELAKGASDATLARIVAEAKYRFLRGSDPGLMEGEVTLLGDKGSNSDLLQTLRNSRAIQSSNYARLLAQFGPNYPDVKQQKSQLDETTRQVEAEQARILNQAQLSYSAAAANEQMNQQALEKQRQQLFGQRNEMVKYVILLHDYESHRTLYEGLFSRLQEAGITAGLEGGEVDIVDLAVLPVTPVRPGPLTYLLATALAGLFIGCVLAFVAEALGTHISTPEQAKQEVPFTLLAALPHFRGKDGSVDPLQQSSYAEAVESLRTALLGRGPTSNAKVYMVTSSLPNEGTSTICLNLATVLAQHHARVLLLDCDLRATQLADRLGLSSESGLVDVLNGVKDLESSVRAVQGVDGLSILVSGKPTSTRPSLLLGSTEMDLLVKHLRNTFDFVILSCPPVLGSSDVLTISSVADSIVFNVRNGSARRQAVKQAIEAIQPLQTPTFGYILNDVRPALLAF